MFSGFLNLDTTYTPNNFQEKMQYGGCPQSDKPILEVSPNKPFEIINKQGDLVGYFWYYGNSVDLHFDITGEIAFDGSDDVYMSAADFMTQCSIVARFYNYRGEMVIEYTNNECNNLHNDIVYQVTTNDEGEIKGDCTISIDSEVSNMKFVKGTYTMELMISHPSGYNATLFSVDTCKFNVR